MKVCTHQNSACFPCLNYHHQFFLLTTTKQICLDIAEAFLAAGGSLSDLNEPRHEHDRTQLPRDPVDIDTRADITNSIGK